jgi:uncharacterized protein involved in exopolysaccharide biosynthesis
MQMSTVEDKQPTLLGYDIDLAELGQILARRAKLIVACIVIALLLAVGYLHFAVYRYTATLMVSPVLSSSDGSSSKLGGLSNLASLAGIGVGGDAGSQAFMLYQQGIFSRDAAEQLSKRSDIMHAVFHKDWDEGAQRWIRPTVFHQQLASFVKGLVGIPVTAWHAPDAAALQQYITENVQVDSDPQKPSVTITYRDADPQFAVAFLHALDLAVDNKLRANDLARADQYVGYLSNQLDKVTNSDVRQSLVMTLADQERTRMMANSPAPYAAQPFGPPSASDKPTNPKPWLVLAGAIFLGGLIGILVALWMPEIQRPRRHAHGDRR